MMAMSEQQEEEAAIDVDTDGSKQGSLSEI
jgi:hypothetical protein